MNLTILLIILYKISSIFTQLVEPCLPAQKCITSLNFSDVKCSIHGKCFYDALGYYTSNKTQSFQTCVCDEEYTNLHENDYVKCCYKRKSQFTAFLLEFVFGFGLGHLYLGNYFIGTVKLVSYICLCCSFCFICICFCYRDDGSSYKKDERVAYYEKTEEIRIKTSEHPLKFKILNMIMIFSALGYFIWQFVDAFLMGLNLYKDGNGVDPHPW